MAPKKKTITAIGSSGAERPVPVRASSGPVADRTRAAAREHQHRPASESLASGVVRAPDDGLHTAKSKDGAGPPQAVLGPPGVSLCPYGRRSNLQDAYTGTHDALFPVCARRAASPCW